MGEIISETSSNVSKTGKPDPEPCRKRGEVEENRNCCISSHAVGTMNRWRWTNRPNRRRMNVAWHRSHLHSNIQPLITQRRFIPSPFNKSIPNIMTSSELLQEEHDRSSAKQGKMCDLPFIRPKTTRSGASHASLKSVFLLWQEETSTSGPLTSAFF